MPRRFQERKCQTDKYTFGSSKAAVIFVDLLNKPENLPIKLKARSILGKQLSYMGKSMAIDDVGFRRVVLTLLHKQFVGTVDKLVSFSNIVKCMMKCVESTQFKELLAESGAWRLKVDRDKRYEVKKTEYDITSQE